MPLLKLFNVCHNYDGPFILSNVNLEVKKREVVTILGNNGVGKTTLMRIISGLLKPTKGEVWFNNENITRLPAHERVKKGIIHCLQGHRVIPNMTVLENLEIAAYIRRNTTRKAIEFIFSLFPHLRDKRSQLAGLLSVGEKQMLAIGMAIILKPKVLVMDEPFSALDTNHTKIIADLIMQLRDSNISVILTSPEPPPITADKLYLLKDGHLKQTTGYY